MRAVLLRLASVAVLVALVHSGCASTPPSAPPAAQVPAPTHPARARLETGQAHLARGEMAAAAAVLRDALRLQPDLPEARAALGRALLGLGDVDGAAAELRALVRREPDFVPGRLALATALVARQEWPAARLELEEVVRRQPDAVAAHYTLGVVRYAQGDVDGALAAYREVLAIDPGHHDARYHVALLLKLAHREAEATPEFLGAARAGVARAQYFAGAAYAGGLGVERDLAHAIAWWTRAAEQGVSQAEESLAQLRLAALGRGRRPAAERQAIAQAFRDYRESLWSDAQGLAREGDESPGAALLRQGRAPEAVVALIRDARALDEPAQQLLETLYAQGVEGALPPHDARILGYLKSAADEGHLRPRLTLARIYALGLGVPKDVARATALLRATPHEDAQRLLQELSAAGELRPARP